MCYHMNYIFLTNMKNKLYYTYFHVVCSGIQKGFICKIPQMCSVCYTLCKFICLWIVIQPIWEHLITFFIIITLLYYLQTQMCNEK